MRRYPGGMPVVAVCPVHGPFASRAIVVQRATNVTFTNNSESCPKCGRLGKIMDGTFNFDSAGLAEVLAAPKWSVEALSAVQRDLRALNESIGDASLPADQFDLAVERALAKLAARDDDALVAKIVDQIKGKPRPVIARFFSGLYKVFEALVNAATATELYAHREQIREILEQFLR